jgi:LmbE family N-acetylglucosaminyl deacetylase
VTNPRHAPPFRRIAAAAILRRAGARGIAIIAPHPDDETLGCGALIAAAARRGLRIAVIALTDGDASHPGSQRWPPAALAAVRRAELRRALARLGAPGARIRHHGARDGDAAGTASLLRLRATLCALDPGLVLVSSPADHHPDHRTAARLAAAAAAALGFPIVHYQVWARADVRQRRPDRHRAAKRRAIAAHRSQVSDYIKDSPAGFRLSANVLTNLTATPEHYVLASTRRPG